MRCQARRLHYDMLDMAPYLKVGQNTLTTRALVCLRGPRRRAHTSGLVHVHATADTMRIESLVPVL